MEERLQVWSSGGGSQSAAIAVLILQGKLPKPDIAVIVDTEREAAPVWEYHDTYVYPALKDIGVELHRIPKSRYATVDLYGSKDKILIPAWTDETGRVGKLPTYCSNEWKKRVVRRFVSEQYKRPQKFETWIGFTTDEMRRVHQELGRWKPVYPLIKLGLSKPDCYELIEKHGWARPPKSSCWMCPNRDHAAWMEMKRLTPDDFNKAVEFERKIRINDDALFLHQSGVTLDKVNENWTSKEPYTGRCSSGMCFV
tara:strand:- start:12 stop:773 length:762 start_codon:yes stop_codon:yes gene_type:complete